MNQFNIHNQNKFFSFKLLPILEKIKNAYLLWYQNYKILPKKHRNSLGEKIDNLFVDGIEATVTAGFLSQKEKLPYVRLANRKMDTLKIFLMLLWETKSINDKKYIALSLKLDEIGKNLGGWA